MTNFDNDWDNLPDKYKEPQIRLISNDTDLSRLKIDPYHWDLEINGVPYQIVRIAGYAHQTGGTQGIYDLWAYPLSKKMTVKNLIAFDGNAPCWGIEWKETNYIKTKWNDSEIRGGGSCIITRNGKPFYEVPGRKMEYALPKAQSLLTELQEYVFPFHFRDWDKKEIGRKVWYNSQPAIVERFILDQGCVILKPDGTDRFKPKPEHMGDEMCGEEMEYAKCEYLDRNVWWFREEKEDFGTKWNQRMDELGAKRGTIEDLKNI